MPMNPRLLRPIASRATLPPYAPVAYTRLWAVTTQTGGTVEGSAESDTGYYAVKWWDNSVDIYESGDPFSKAAAGNPRVFEAYPSDASGEPSGIFEGFDVSGNDLTQLRADNVTLASSPSVPGGFGPWWTWIPGQPAVAEQGKVSNNLLSAEALDQFYTDLDNGTGSLFVAGNPGIDADDPTIATAKGYTVFGSVPPSTSLLLNFNGTNGSTTFTDSSPNGLTVTANGNAQISTAQSKFGGASGYFDGAGDYLTLEDNADFGFGTGDFTIEYWHYPIQNSGSEVIVDLRPGDVGEWLVLGKSGNGEARCYDGGTVRVGGSMNLNAWNHVAWCRASGENTLYLNGVAVIQFTNGGDVGSSRGLTVGSNADPQYENAYGYIDDLRITKGVARYTANFTPPTAQLGVYP